MNGGEHGGANGILLSLLKVVTSGEQADYARDRLTSWGFLKKEPEPAK